MTVEIVPVTDKALLRRFIRVPFAVLRDDKAWTPPLLMEREEAFSPKTNPFLRRAEVHFWLARRDGRDVGRITAQIDPWPSGKEPGASVTSAVCAWRTIPRRSPPSCARQRTF